MGLPSEAGPAHCGLRLRPAGCGASAKPHQAAPPQSSQADRMKAVVRAERDERRQQRGGGAAVLAPGAISLMEGPYGCWCLTPAQVFQFHVPALCSGRSCRSRYVGGTRRGCSAWATGSLEMRLAAGFAHRGAVHDRARQDHRLEAGVVEAAGRGDDPSARAVTLARPVGVSPRTLGHHRLLSPAGSKKCPACGDTQQSRTG